MKSKNVDCRVAKGAWFSLDCHHSTLRLLQHHGNAYSAKGVTCLHLWCALSMCDAAVSDRWTIQERHLDDMCNFS